MAHDIDTATIRDFFDDHIHVDGYCAEVRCLRATVDQRSRLIVRGERNHTVVGWFTRSDELACELKRVRGVSSYITLNPVHLKGRPKAAENRLIQGHKGDFCTDDDIGLLRYLVIDIDPPKLVPPKRENSTAEELQACQELAHSVISEFNLSSCCYTGTSGNGSYVLVKLESLPNSTASREKIYQAVKRIATVRPHKGCHVDGESYKPIHMLAIPGTWKFKGQTESPDRPYRLVTFGAAHEADRDQAGRPTLASA